MRIQWDAPITMDDGVVLRADVFRPPDERRHPVILSYGPYAKGLSFQEGYKSNWERLVKAAPAAISHSCFGVRVKVASARPADTSASL